MSSPAGDLTVAHSGWLSLSGAKKPSDLLASSSLPVWQQALSGLTRKHVMGSNMCFDFIYLLFLTKQRLSKNSSQCPHKALVFQGGVSSFL